MTESLRPVHNGHGYTVGIDIGGSHISAAPLLHPEGTLVREGLVSLPVDAAAAAEVVLGTWADALRRALGAAPAGRELLGVGVAMPGPFDYPNGICLMEGVAKYDALHGVNVRRELKAAAALPGPVPMVFLNDAACFLLGEAAGGAAAGVERVIGLTLGTGFGSAFLAGGRIVESGPGVPEDGWLYSAPFRGSTAEEWFSGRGLLALCERETGVRHATVRELASQARRGGGEGRVLRLYGRLLGGFLAPWVEGFSARLVVIGGNISRSMDLFGGELQAVLGKDVLTAASALGEEAALVGAGMLPLNYAEPPAPGNQ